MGALICTLLFALNPDLLPEGPDTPLRKATCLIVAHEAMAINLDPGLAISVAALETGMDPKKPLRTKSHWKSTKFAAMAASFPPPPQRDVNVLGALEMEWVEFIRQSGLDPKDLVKIRSKARKALYALWWFDRLTSTHTRTYCAFTSGGLELQSDCPEGLPLQGKLLTLSVAFSEAMKKLSQGGLVPSSPELHPQRL